MTAEPIELPRRDREQPSDAEHVRENHEGVLAWMGRHKLATALTASALVAGGVVLTPGAMQWLRNALSGLAGKLTPDVGEWMNMFTNWLKDKIPGPLKAAWDAGDTAIRLGKKGIDIAGKSLGKAIDVAKAGAGHAVNTVKQAGADVAVMANNPGATAQGFVDGLKTGAGNIAKPVTKAAGSVARDAQVMASNPAATAGGFAQGLKKGIETNPLIAPGPKAAAKLWNWIRGG